MQITDELWHPLTAHFPIAFYVLLLFLTPLKFFKNTRSWSPITCDILAWLTGGFFLLSIFLGDMALEVVKPVAKNLTLIYQHEQLAEIALIYVIIGIVFQTAEKLVPKKYKTLMLSLTLTTAIIGNYYLYKTAHAGAELVYRYGTGVNLHQ